MEIVSSVNIPVMQEAYVFSLITTLNTKLYPNSKIPAAGLFLLMLEL